MAHLAGPYCDRRLGGIERWSIFPPKDWGMRIPDDNLDCVVFLGCDVPKTKEYPDGRRFLGTGFFVHVPVPSGRGGFVYLVTAKHVANDLAGNAWLRVNSVEGVATYFDISGVRWIDHPKHSASQRFDVSVSPDVALPPDLFRYRTIPREAILAGATDLAGKYIGIGDDLFIVGLFSLADGARRITPIVRSGTLAMLPEEKISTDFGDINAYLAEARSIGGISGSPVFVRQALSLKGFDQEVMVGGRIYLLGLMQDHWDVNERDINKVNPAAGGVNLGVAVVVPSYQILETIDHPILMQERTEADEQRKRAHMATTDSLPLIEKTPRGPEPERLVIDGEWTEAIKRGLQKKPPEKA